MSHARIHHSLKEVLSRHRLVFWYDAPVEWDDCFHAFDAEGVDKVEVRGNEFGAKVKILDPTKSQGRFLVYVPSPRPPDRENWLLDLLLQGHEFKADRASLAVQEAGLPYEFRSLAEEHVSFFKEAKRLQRFKDLVLKDDQASDLRLKMMAVLVRSAVDIDAVLLELLHQMSEEEMFDPVQGLFEAHGLVNPFWRVIKLRFQYDATTPSLKDFVVTLFRGANPLDGQIVGSAHGSVFLQRWKDSQKYGPSFATWSARLEKELHIEARLDAVACERELGEADAFEAFERFILHRLCRSFEAEAPSNELLRTIQLRRHSFWHERHQHGYLALTHALELREGLAKVELQVESLEAGWQRYQASWWKIDRAYRRCCFHLRRYGQVKLMEALQAWVNKNYVNNFLLPLADQWSDKVVGMSSWKCGVVPEQRRFFETCVRPFLSRGQKIFVIISDALRYEAAADFAERIQSENRFTAEVSAMLSVLPSYTQLGMASLLPGQVMSINTEQEGLTVQLDGTSATGTDNRAKILNGKLEGRGTAIQSEEFLALNSKTEGRTLMKEHDVIYIYHNVIDKTGDSAVTEAKTFEAVEQAFEELSQIIRKVTAINGSNILLTADHGFLFQQEDVHEGDISTLPVADSWIHRNRRFAVGLGLKDTSGVKNFTAAQLGLPGEWSATFPLSLGRFPLQGSGKRFVHGGFSLQEVVIPVVHINKARADDTARVEVEIMRVPAKITTGQLSFSLYQEHAVTTKRLARTLRVGIFSSGGKPLSEEKTFTFDSKEEEARHRETHVLLMLSAAADQYNNQTLELRLEEALPGTNQAVLYKSHSIKLQKPFASDFDEF